MNTTQTYRNIYNDLCFSDSADRNRSFMRRNPERGNEY